MANEFDEYEEIEAAEDTAWKPEHDFTIFAEEAESSDAIPFDEDLGAALDAEFKSVLESQIEQDEDPDGYDDDIPEDGDDPDGPIGFDTLRQQIDEFEEYTDENGEHPYAYVTDVYRAYTKLHEHLTPYITEICKEASTTGMPVIRHLVLGWQNDKNVYTIDDEYTFGDAFLIAPILTDATSRSVYLPEGVWEDVLINTDYEITLNSLVGHIWYLC